MSAARQISPTLEPPVLRAVAPVSAEKQQWLGQFFSPRAVADLLASFVNCDGAEVRMLDAGAGAGALIAATVRHACSAKRQPRNFAVTAWEIDDAVIPALQKRAPVNHALPVQRPQF